MDDKQSMVPIVEEHVVIFGKGKLKSASTDKGYWSAKNQRALIKRHIENGLQRPANIESQQGVPSLEDQERLRNRSAGIEPPSRHVKHEGQLGRSRMKSDAVTLATRYASVLGFNLRQLNSAQQMGRVKAA